MNPVPIFEMFPFLKRNEKLASDYSGARVTSVVLNGSKTKMSILLSLARPAPPYEIAVMENLIAAEYAMEGVSVEFAVRGEKRAAGDTSEALPKYENPGSVQNAQIKGEGKSGAKSETPEEPDTAAAAPAMNKGSAIQKKPPATAIMGRVTKAPPKPMSDVTIDDGRVTIRGYVCAERSRATKKGMGFLLDFDITDYTNTLSVSSFYRDEKAQKIAEKIKEGMYLTVSGTPRIYNDELTLDPQNIFVSEDTKAVRMDKAKEKRVELHMHTRMSVKDALTDVGELIARAEKWGHTAIAITDHGVVHSFPEAEKAAADTKGKVKVIYGMEGYLRDGSPPDTPAAKARRYHVIILAKNKTGLKNLYKLVSISHIKYIIGKRPVIYKSILQEHREGLIIGSACESGELFSAITAGKDDDELKKIAQFYDYLEIQPICNNRFMLAGVEPVVRGEDGLREFNRKVVEIGQMLDIPVAATCDAHFLDPEDEIFRKIILTGNGYADAARELPLYYRTTEEMLEEFSYLGKKLAYEVVVTNTNIVAEMCDVIELLPKGKLFAPRLPGSADELEKIIVEAVPKLYGDTPPYRVTDRINNELKSILKLEYDVIYMAAQKLVAYLKSQGSRVGSRGSVGSSFVAYLAGITEVNPLEAHYRCPICKYMEFAKPGTFDCGADMPDKPCPKCGAAYIKDGFNIPFETFLGLSGEKVPDIDLNISGEHGALAQRFVYEMFGWDYVYRAGTIGKIAEKTAFGYVKKYLENTGKKVTKAEINRLCAGCLGVKQTTSQHPGGLIIIPQDMEVTDFCPVQYPSDEKKTLADDIDEEIIITHFDYHKMEENLIKLDMLGHDNPTMLVMLERLTGVNADDIKLDDANTMSVFSSPLRLGLPEDDDIIGKTGAIGIPEFGTLTARRMLCETKPENFDMLVRLSGYAHGINVWFGNSRELILEGKATVAQTISSRDDIMLYLISMGMEGKEAFALSESVRKGRGLPKGSESKLRALDVPQWYIDSCNKITYLFPRAHAVAYVMMAFRIAWFKVHRPLEYYSAHFYRRSQGGAFDAYIMTRGIDIVRSEIRRIYELMDAKKASKKDTELFVTLESCYEFYLRGFDFTGIDLYESDAERFLPGKDSSGKEYLIPPLIAINGLGSAAALSIAGHRNGRQFVSVEELLSVCTGVNKSNIAELRRMGALGDMPETSQIGLF